MVGHFQEFEDEYLEMMYEFFEQDKNGLVRTGELAEKLGVSPASVTEMLRRLATKGMVLYTPYKGAQLTDKGLVHGKRMKRRHRLAELLLELLPFEGNHHETACRLEHAINDELEVCLSILFLDKKVDPSGREIPHPDEVIEQRIHELERSHMFLSTISKPAQYEIVTMFIPQEMRELFDQHNISVGTTLLIDESLRIYSNGVECKLEEEVKSKILVKVVEK